MEASDEKINVTIVQSPPVVLNRIPQIDTYEVMAGDLAELERVVGDEAQALGFFTFCFGVFVPSVLSWLGGNSVTLPWLYPLASGVSGLGTLWFGLIYLRRHRSRPKILERIRERRTL